MNKGEAETPTAMEQSHNETGNLDLNKIHKENEYVPAYWCGYLSQAIRSHLRGNIVDLKMSLANYDRYSSLGHNHGEIEK